MALDPVTAALDLGGKLIERIFPDKEKQDAAKLELMKLQLSGDLAEISGQMEINKVEAANPTLFVSGWRPFCGWVCGIGLAYVFLFQPLGTAFSGMLHHPVDFPGLDTDVLLTCLGGMLGLGGLRTYEKAKGVHRS